MAHGPFQNSLLRCLGHDVVERLHLRPVHFELLHELEYPGRPLDHLFFLEEGMASMTATFRDGSQVEVCMFGFESIVGVSALMGTKRSLNRVYTQIAGSGYSSPVEAARREFRLGGAFQDLALRYVQAQLVQSTQSTGCNAKHGIEQRLCRWLLLCADRTHRTTFRLPQEFIADMLGTTRPTVSLAAGLLKEAGLIEFTRGTVHIVDAGGLERRACECYAVIKQHLDNYAEFDSGLAHVVGSGIASHQSTRDGTVFPALNRPVKE